MVRSKVRIHGKNIDTLNTENLILSRGKTDFITPDTGLPLGGPGSLERGHGNSITGQRIAPETEPLPESPAANPSLVRRPPSNGNLSRGPALQWTKPAPENPNCWEPKQQSNGLRQVGAFFCPQDWATSSFLSAPGRCAASFRGLVRLTFSAFVPTAKLRPLFGSVGRSSRHEKFCRASSFSPRI